MEPATDSREWRLEQALRELRRFANRVATHPATRAAITWPMSLAAEANTAQDVADAALGYCGCPDCSAVEDARRAGVGETARAGRWGEHDDSGRR